METEQTPKLQAPSVLKRACEVFSSSQQGDKEWKENRLQLPQKLFPTIVSKGRQTT
jgi:hypothetical protein